MHVARVLGVTREDVFAHIAQACGIDPCRIASEQDLLAAMEAVEALRLGARQAEGGVCPAAP